MSGTYFIHINSLIKYSFSQVVGAARILPLFSLWLVKDDQQDRARGLDSPSFIFSLMKRQEAEGKEKVVSLNLIYYLV